MKYRVKHVNTETGAEWIVPQVFTKKEYADRLAAIGNRNFQDSGDSIVAEVYAEHETGKTAEVSDD